MSAPGYWQNETSGVLAPVVRRLIEGHELDAGEVATMRAYFRQWMTGPWRGDGIAEIRADVELAHTHADVLAWLERAVSLGVDPL